MPASLSPSIGSTTLTCQPRSSIASSSMRLPSICNLFRENWQQDHNSPYRQLDPPEANNTKPTEGYIDLTVDSPQDSFSSARIHRFSASNNLFGSTAREPDYFASLDNFLDMAPRRRRESTVERSSKRPRASGDIYSRLPSPPTSTFLSRPSRSVFKLESSPIVDDSVIDLLAPEPISHRRKRKASQEPDSTLIEESTTLEPKNEQDRQLAETIKAQSAASAGPTKLSEITCIICMDRIENMTATHCGHIFCHTCIQEALIAGENPTNGPMAPKCPMCRTKVNRKPRGKQAPEMIPLCLKLKKRDKGKQKEKQ